MKEKYLLNIAINSLLEENYSIRLESHKPIIFSFEYYNYKFYLSWYSKRGYEDFLYLEYRAYLTPLGCSHCGASEYIKIAKQRNKDIDFKVHKEYISYVIEFYIEDYDDFTYSTLRSGIDRILEVLRYLEIDIKEIIEAEYEDIDDKLKEILSEKNDPNWFAEILDLTKK